MASALASASPLVRTICASAPPSSLVVSASASADAIRARLAPSACAITACASAAAGLTMEESNSFSFRSASSCASSVCLRTTSCCASAIARGPAWSARACAAATCVFVSASRSETSRPALILICCASASRTAASWSVEAFMMRASRDTGDALLAHQLDVVRLVREARDGEGVDLQPAGGEVALGRVLYLLEELLPVADQLFDRQGADDRSQRSFQYVLDDRVDLLGVGV